MSRTRAQVEAAARETLESGNPDFTVIAIEPYESGRMYVIAVPLTVVRRGLSGRTTKFGWSLYDNLNAVRGCDVSHHAVLPTSFTMYVDSEMAGDPLPCYCSVTRELPADACVAIQATIMRFRKRRHNLADFFRSL
jgi:hypothetical protein